MQNQRASGTICRLLGGVILFGAGAGLAAGSTASVVGAIGVRVGYGAMANGLGLVIDALIDQAQSGEGKNVSCPLPAPFSKK